MSHQPLTFFLAVSAAWEEGRPLPETMMGAWPDFPFLGSANGYIAHLKQPTSQK